MNDKNNLSPAAPSPAAPNSGALSPEAGIEGAASFAAAESREILNLLNDGLGGGQSDDAGGCCGGGCCSV